MLVDKNNPLEVEFYANNSFCFKELIGPLIFSSTLQATLLRRHKVSP